MVPDVGDGGGGKVLKVGVNVRVSISVAPSTTVVKVKRVVPSPTGMVVGGGAPTGPAGTTGACTGGGVVELRR